MDMDDVMTLGVGRRSELLPRECSALRDDVEQVEELSSTDGIRRSDSIADMQNLPSRENIPLSVIVSGASCVSMQTADVQGTYRSVHTSEPSRSDSDDYASSTDEEEEYRKQKRRYKRRGFFASLLCCVTKGDAVDGLIGEESYEDKLAELRYEKASLAEKKVLYRELRFNIEEDQVDFVVPKTSFNCCCRGLFSNFNALEKLIQARGGGGATAVFELIRQLLMLNFIIGVIFLAGLFVLGPLVYLPKDPQKTSGPCNETADPAGNFFTYANCQDFIIDCSDKPLKSSKTNRLFWDSEPEYETDDHVYNLIRLQTLSWLALPVSPMMPLLVCLVLLIYLFVNLLIVLVMKLRPKQWFGRARSSSFFATALLMGWIMCIWPIINIMFQRKPSKSCSPFRNLDQQYRAILSEKHSFIVLHVLMLCFVEAILLMLFFILRPPDVSVTKSKTRKGNPWNINGPRRAIEKVFANPSDKFEDFLDVN
ncbi:TMC protein [Trinorchestia longiramus]|nr:TMC protein [Trinorchestia longiramus]